MKRSREPEEHLEHDLRGGDDGDDSHASPRYDKTPALDEDEGEDGGEIGTEGGSRSGSGFAMRCSLPPHKEALGFRTYGDYEAHYQKSHTNRCLECRKNFPTEHLLGIHIEECHDPLARVARERGEHTYSCFVEGCARKCMTPQKRRLHLIDKHSYPKNFFFAITKQGVDGRRSLLNEGGGRHRRRTPEAASQQLHGMGAGRRGSTQESRAQGAEERKPPVVEPGSSIGAADAAASEEKKGDATEGEESKTEREPQDIEMAELTGAMSALQFVPPSIRFGRGRAGFPKKR